MKAEAEAEVKAEEENMTTATTSSSTSEDFNPCPICLGPFLQESYLDKCFHRFCYNCIRQWIKVVSGKRSCKFASVTCPLCKIENFSIIHGFDGSSFQQSYVTQDFENGFVLTKAHKYRLQSYYTEPGFLSDIFSVSRYWKSHKYLQPNHWLHSWLRREIQALMQEEDVDIVVHHIVGVINSFQTKSKREVQRKTPEAKSEEFRSLISDAARPFLAARTDRFVNEVELFLASGLTIEAYDAVYKQRLGWSAPRVTGESTEGELSEQRTTIPYLYIFDEDSDETD
ncbi:TNF receptor-associated factor [Parasponia andersonii]|uniref:TNF receptor-associated factor n=1 Tax=Parasponia andersonii TaxID=3476 RepID=A0A2P5DSV6_PARAD|nr:TNF receptor-associated factor [Parasponia andersonii]